MPLPKSYYPADIREGRNLVHRRVLVAHKADGPLEVWTLGADNVPVKTAEYAVVDQSARTSRMFNVNTGDSQLMVTLGKKPCGCGGRQRSPLETFTP